MNKIIVLSLDYDGCADILFESPTKMALAATRLKLEHLFKEIIAGAKEVELYVGSNRQSHAIDKLNCETYHNGSCFVNFQELSKSKKWTFRPLLLADVENGKPEGTAIKDQYLNCSFDRNKIKTIQNQLNNIAMHHPHDEVHLYFLDDDCDHQILPSLNQYLQTQEQNIPCNIHIHLVKFDWYGEVFEGQETLIERAYIKGKKESALAPKQSIQSDYQNRPTFFDSYSSVRGATWGFESPQKTCFN